MLCKNVKILGVPFRVPQIDKQAKTVGEPLSNIFSNTNTAVYVVTKKANSWKPSIVYTRI